VELALELDPTHFQITVWAYGPLGGVNAGGDPRVAGHLVQITTADTSALVPCPSTTGLSWT
jgi:hypothetical protein